MAFHFHDWLRKKGKLGIVWMAAVDEKQVQRREWLSENLIQTCGFIREYIENEDKVSAKQKVVLGCIAENLAYGASVVFKKKVQAFLDEILKGSEYFDRVERLKDRPEADESDGDSPDDKPGPDGKPGDKPRRKKPRVDIDLHIKRSMPYTLPKTIFNQPEDFGKIELFRSPILYDDDENVSDFEFYQPPPIDEQLHIAQSPDITMVEAVVAEPTPAVPVEDLQMEVDEVFLYPSKEGESVVNVTEGDATTSAREISGHDLQLVEDQTPKQPVAPEAGDGAASARESLMPIAEEEEEEESASRDLPEPPPKPKVPRRKRQKRDVAIELTDVQLRNQINTEDDIPPLIDRWADIRRRIDVINIRDVLRLPGRRELRRSDIFCRIWDNRLLRQVDEPEDVGILLPEGIQSPPHVERELQPTLDEIQQPFDEVQPSLRDLQPSLPEIAPTLSPPVRPVATAADDFASFHLGLSLSPPEQPPVAPSTPVQLPVVPSLLVQPPSPPLQPPVAQSPPMPPPVAPSPPGPLPNGNGSPPHPPSPVQEPLPNGNGRPPYPSPPPPMSPQPAAGLPEGEGLIIIDNVRYKVFEEIDMARRIIHCNEFLNDGETLTFEILAPPKGPTNRLGASVVFKHLLEFSRRRWLNLEQLEELGTIEVTIRDNGIISKLGGRPYTSPLSSLSTVPSDVDVSQLSFSDD